MKNPFKSILSCIFQKKSEHIWKEERRENLGSFLHFGSCPSGIETMYRIAVFERCLVTGDTRIREISDFFPAKENT